MPGGGKRSKGKGKKSRAAPARRAGGGGAASAAAALPAYEPDLCVRALPCLVDERFDDETDNPAEPLVPSLRDAARSKLVWHVRHGQSEGNVAREQGRDYQADASFVDTPLSAHGTAEARGASALVAKWGERPTLVVCSAMTRAVQTAALMFGELLASGEAALVVRPELREFWPDNIENCGRPLDELRDCPALAGSAAGSAAVAAVVREALSEAATKGWAGAWDAGQAGGDEGRWQAHCVGGDRLEAFRHWLSAREETRVAVVSHWGTINNLLNREPWAEDHRQGGRFGVAREWFPESWPAAGLAQMFAMRNCGWVCVEYCEEEEEDG